MNLREITIAYGMTETSPVSFQSSTDDPIERRVSTVGRIHPHLEVKIVDAEGRIVPRGVAGELCTRGYSVMPGYWDDEERTRDGDRRRRAGCTPATSPSIDAEGFCNIVGRIKDLVIRGGENVYPREIEEFLYAHPAIQDVQVFGVAGRALWRGGLRLGQAAARRDADRSGGAGLLPRPDRASEDPALRPLRRRVPDDGHRQDAEVPHARDDGARTWAAQTRHSMTGT